MYRRNCIDTMECRHFPLSTCQGAPLTWQHWFAIGKRLCAQEIRRVGEMCALWRFRMRSRHALAELDTRMLKDIGVTHDQTSREVSRKFWQHS